MVRATPETLTLARRRAQPRAAYIARLTLTAVFAYLLALQFAGNKGPVLAPLTALLVIQVSLTHTLRSAARRVLSVVTGVLVAIGLSALVGFTWWSLGLVIVAALAVGLILRLGDDLLEVPISAMLILSAVGSTSAASGRIVETLIGAAAGLAGGLLFAPVRLQPAEEAIDDLSARLASLLRQTAADIADGADPGRSAERLAQARTLGGEVQRVEIALADSEESLRLNPRARILPQAAIPLRTGLETLEHTAMAIRAISRWVAEASRPGIDSPLRDPAIRDGLAEVLGELAASVEAIGDHVRAGIAAAVEGPARAPLRWPASAATPGGHSDQDQVESDLDQSLGRAQLIQDELAGLLRAEPGPGQPDPPGGPAGQPAWPTPAWPTPDWSMRGELLMLLDRLRYELQDEHRARVRESWPARGDARRRSPRWVPRHPGTRPRSYDRPDRPVRPRGRSLGRRRPAGGPRATRARTGGVPRAVPRARCASAGLESLSHNQGGSE